MSESTPRARSRGQIASALRSSITLDGRTVEATARLVRPSWVATPAYVVECGDVRVRLLGGESRAREEMDRLLRAELGLDGNTPGPSGVDGA